MKYRSRTDILGSMIEAVAEEGGTATKTRIMFRSYLSYTQLTEYLDLLVANKLLSILPNGKYHLEQKGRDYLKAKSGVDSFIKVALTPNK